MLAGVAGDVDEEDPEPLAPPGAVASESAPRTTVPAPDEPVLATGSVEELPLVILLLAFLASAFISQ